MSRFPDMKFGIKMRPRHNEKIQITLRRMRKVLEKEGILKDMKRKMYYESPSQERNKTKHRKKREAEKERMQQNPRHKK